MSSKQPLTIPLSGYLILILFLPIATLIVAYTIYYSLGFNDYNIQYIPSVSTTISESPASHFGMMGSALSVFYITLLYLFKYRYSQLHLSMVYENGNINHNNGNNGINNNDGANNNDNNNNNNSSKGSGKRIIQSVVVRNRLYRLNQFNLLMGISSTLSLLGLASFQSSGLLRSWVVWTHGTFSVIFFGAGIIYAFTQTYFDVRLRLISTQMKVFRLSITFLNIVFIFIYMIGNEIDTNAALTISGLAELLTVVTFLLYYFSFYFELSRMDLIIDIKLKPNLSMDDGNTQQIDKFKEYNNNNQNNNTDTHNNNNNNVDNIDKIDSNIENDNIVVEETDKDSIVLNPIQSNPIPEINDNIPSNHGNDIENSTQ